MLARSVSSRVSAGEVYDVAIVGAGMVGAALAALLRANPLTASMRVALIDQQHPPSSMDMPQHPDLRVSTITAANIDLLHRAGAWDELQQAAQTFQHIQVWEYAGPGFVSWHASDIGRPHMGCVVENRLLQAAVLRAATGRAEHTASKGDSDRLANYVYSSNHGHCGGGGSSVNIHTNSSRSSSYNSSSRQYGCLDLKCPESVRALRLPTPQSRVQGFGSTHQGSTAGSTGGRTGSTSWPSSSTISSSTSSSGALAQLELSDGSTLHCRLVVAADGARSKVRDLAGLRTVGWSYNQRGLVATVATAGPNDTAWQRFLPTGPLALLPVRGGYSNIVWTVTPDMARVLERYSSSKFCDEVNAVLQPHPDTFASAESMAAAAAVQGIGSIVRAAGLGRLINPGASLQGFGASTEQWRRPPLVTGWVGSSPKSFPLHLQHAGRYVAPRMALVGDAAHAVHPMAGQGVNLGLADAGALAATLAFARQTGQDIGDVMLLQSRYEAQRQAANVAMMAALETLWQGFGLQSGVAGAARAAGLRLLNSIGPVKNSIMQYAMGFTG